MKIRSSGVEPPDVDMTPMIDIVFQLIAFFMVVTNFDQQDADERISLPRDQLAQPPVQARDNTFTINFGYRLDEDGRKIMDTPFLFTSSGEYTLDAFREVLLSQARFYKNIDVDIAEVTVEIRADSEIRTGLVQRLIEMCQAEDVQFQRFSLKATRDGA